jgi:HAD superfamily hydrolase (TIGR01459 family)
MTEAARRRITEIGIAPALYDALLSSGEAAWQWLAAGKAPGPHLYPIMAARDGDMLEGVPAKAVARIEAADFILNTGVESAGDRVEDFEEVLAAGAGRGLLMVCANPDLMVIHAGKPEICAGALALRYEELGGRVQYFGKPHAPIYDACLALLAVADRRRILAVGDSLRTDIAGARGAGIGSLLVLGGIHQEELTGGDLETVVRRAGVRPDAAVASFRW